MSGCPACGGPLAPWREVPSGEPRDPRRFELARCGLCGGAVTLGDPPGAEAYERGVYTSRPPRAAGLLGRLQHMALAQPVRMLRRAGVAPGARVLDAGAGRGRLVEALRTAGYDARGIEPAARGGGAGTAVARATIAGHEDSGLDAVALWHVLEHLDDPAGALERIRAWLAPGGVLLAGVPNLASWQAAIAGERWMHLDAPRHRTHFTPAGLSTLLGRHGLAVEHTAHMVWEHNPAAMWMALLSRAGAPPAYAFHLLKRSAPARPGPVALTLLGLPLLPVAAGLEGLAAARGRGGTIAVVARAPG